MEIKLFDKKDYDYYNPTPYINHLVSFCDTKIQHEVSWEIDSEVYDYLFTYLNEEDRANERKKKRVFSKDFTSIIKSKHADRVIRSLERVVDAFSSDLDSRVETQKRRIRNSEENLRSLEVGIKEQIESIAREKEELKELENVIEKYTTKDKTGTPELPF